MKLNQLEILQFFIIAAMWIAGALIWPQAPEKVPSHWNFAGEIDGYASKTVGLFVIPAIATGIFLLLLVLSKLELGDGFKSSMKAHRIIITAVMTALAVAQGVVLFAAQGRTVNMNSAMYITLGAILIITGNFCGKLRQNRIVGVRTPWTLKSKHSWNRTHRVAGLPIMFTGLVFAVGGLVNSNAIYIAGAVLLLTSVIGLSIYSWVLWRDDPERAES